ncbi:alpha/beta fold hydrolase [Microbacteriaceae bacterium 4G12]
MNQFININHKKIEVLQKGSRGIPVIILTGMGCSFDEWYEITESLCRVHKVIMFHRPGLGDSEIGDESRNTYAVVEELKELLKELKILEPIVLVGHSYGGLCAQHFAKVYPQKTAGVTLVDSTSEDLKILDELDLPILDEESSDEIWMKKCESYSFMSEEEIRKEENPVLTKKQRQFPSHIQQRLIDFQIKPSLYKAMYSELESWKKDAEIIKGLGKFADIPLIVIGRDKKYNIKLGIRDGLPITEIRLLEEKWQELIMNQTSLSSNSHLVFAPQASHSIHLDRPDIVIESIYKIVESVSY